MNRIKKGQVVSWQRQHCNKFTGTIIAFCPKNNAINTIEELNNFSKLELKRININNSGIDRYLIYVSNIGVVSVAAATIEQQNPNSERE